MPGQNNLLYKQNESNQPMWEGRSQLNRIILEQQKQRESKRREKAQNKTTN